MNLQPSDWISCAAFLVSLTSLGWSIYATRIDRANIKAVSTLYTSDEQKTNTRMEIKVTNHGRRIAVLTLFGGNLKSGGWAGTHLGKKDLGLHLSENEFYKMNLSFGQVFCVGPENDEQYVDLWFEDSQGRRYVVKGARKHIQEMASNMNSQPS